MAINFLDMIEMGGFRKYLIQFAWLILVTLPLNTVNAQDPIKIMPLGNSITRGSMCVNGNIYSCVLNADSVAIGYRYRLYTLLNAAGYHFDLVGKKNYGYAIFSDTQNSGFDGIRSSDLADVMQTGTSTFTGQVTPGPYLNYYPADIILLHIGTNDILAHNTSVTNVSRILDAIDTYENVSGKPVLVFLARVISENGYPCNTHSETVTFNNNLVAMAQTRINNGDHIVLVDMECNAGLDYFNDLVDQVHPDQAGYTKMADLWFQSINNYNSAPLVSQIPEQVTDRGTPFNKLILDNYVTDVENAPDEMFWSYLPSTPQHFIITINSNREVTATPIDPGWSGSETIQFTATDRGKVLPALKKSASTSVVFTVNWIPEITGQADLSTPEEMPLTLSPVDLLIVEPEKAPPGLTLTVNPGENYTVNGTTITPTTDFNGNLSVPVQLSVDGKISNLFSLQVNVTPVNDPPTLVSQKAIVTNRNESVVVSISDIVYTDPDNAPGDHHFKLLPGDQYTLDGDTIFPAKNFYGDLSVNASLSDLTDTITFTLDVQVNYQNITPEFTSVPLTEATENEPYTYVVTASDADVTDPLVNQSLTFWADSIPGWMTFNSTTNDILVGVPKNEDVGSYYIRLAVSDGIDTVYQAFTLTVINVNNPPVITGQQADISGIKDSFRVVSTSDLVIQDPDNQLSEMQLILLPGSDYTFDGDTVFFAPGFTGTLSVNLEVNDGTDNSNVFGLTITVTFGAGWPLLKQDLLTAVYPNPAGDEVWFVLKNDQPCRIEIRDVTGKVLILKGLGRYAGKLRVDVSGLTKGIYLYRIYNDRYYQAGKLIINR